jgi:hypothetical protein
MRFMESSRGALVSALAIGLAILFGSTPDFTAQARPPADEAAPLPSPLDELARSFRAGSAGLLRTLLPGGEKIHVSSPSLGLKTGYYSGDQIFFLFEDLFRSRKTLKFNILRGAEIPPGSQRLKVVARWSYHKGSSRDFTAEMAFDLVLRDGAWSIQEIREFL